MTKGRKKTKNRKNGKFSVKLIITIILIITVVASSFVVMRYLMPTESSSYIVTKKGDDITLMAHRGLSAIAPENTVASLESAGIVGFSCVEFDVHTTKDGVWVVMHDSEIDRMTDGSGRISDYTYSELKEFNINAGNNIGAYDNLKIPTVDEALTVCSAYDIKAFIEIKECDESLIGNLLDKIESYDVDAEVISFDLKYLEKAREFKSDIDAKLLVNKITDDVIKSCKDNNFGISFNHKSFGNFFKLKQVKEDNISVVAWTVDSVIMADICYLFGVRTITTNRILP